MNNNTLALSQLSFIPHSCLTYCTKITFIWLMLAWKTLNLFWELKHIMHPTSRHDLICSILIFGRFSCWETDFHMKQISNTKNNFFQLYWHATRTKYIQCFQCHANWLIDFKQFLEHNAKMKYVTLWRIRSSWRITFMWNGAVNVPRKRLRTHNSNYSVVLKNDATTVHYCFQRQCIL